VLWDGKYNDLVSYQIGIVGYSYLGIKGTKGIHIYCIMAYSGIQIKMKIVHFNYNLYY